MSPLPPPLPYAPVSYVRDNSVTPASTDDGGREVKQVNTALAECRVFPIPREPPTDSRQNDIELSLLGRTNRPSNSPPSSISDRPTSVVYRDKPVFPLAVGHR